MRGPDRGDEVGEQYLYPSEFLKFVTHAEVPMQWKRVVALAIYMYPRDAELRAMRCRDLDLEHAVCRITKALNRRNGEEKATTGRRSRRVPLERTLVRLLKASRRAEAARPVTLPICLSRDLNPDGTVSGELLDLLDREIHGRTERTEEELVVLASRGRSLLGGAPRDPLREQRRNTQAS